MPFDVTMPDGTLIRNVPDGTTKGDLAAKYAAHVSSQPTNPLSQMGRQAGLTARYLAEGAASPFASLADIPTAAVDAGLSAFGADQRWQIPEQNQAVSAALTKLRLPQPQTPVERVVGDISRGGASVGSGVGIGRALESVAQPVVSSVGSALQSTPGLQTVSSTLGSAAGGVAREMGLPPWLQTTLGLTAGAVPFAKGGAAAAVQAMAGSGAVKAQAQSAIARGYVLPPVEADAEPTAMSSLASGGSGKIKLSQAASTKNQEVTNALAASELGLAPDTTLTKDAINNVRAQAGQAKDAIKTAIPIVDASPNNPAGLQFQNDVQSVAGVNPQVATFFPQSAKNEGIDKLVSDLGNLSTMSTDAALESVRHFRSEAVGNLRGYDPQSNALGLAQRRAADAIDSLIENTLAQSGQSDLVNNYRAARQLQAKTYDVEKALNESTGNVSAQKLAGLSNAGRPLSGNLKTIANTFSAFPRSMQSPDRFGGTEPHSILDMLAAGGAVMSGHPGAAAAVLSRPALRNAVLSPLYQRSLAGLPMSRAPLALPLANAALPTLTRPMQFGLFGQGPQLAAQGQ